jgi:hypothetical protein
MGRAAVVMAKGAMTGTWAAKRAETLKAVFILTCCSCPARHMPLCS